MLDISHGEGGPSLRFAHGTGCALVGIDFNPQAIATATALADERGLGVRVRFARHDAAQPLPFPDQAFDAVVCVDALVGLPDRPRIFAESARDLKPSGRLVFTDPVLTGPLSNAELAARSPFFFVLTPPGYNERLLDEAVFELLRREDVTADLAEMARRYGASRAAHADALLALEGDEVFAGQNQYRVTAEPLARERRLSHVAFLARKPA